MSMSVEGNLVVGKALDYRFYCLSSYGKKAFAYRVPLGDYSYLQCSQLHRKIGP